MTSNCPTCGTPSNKTLQQFDRTLPEPAVKVTRFQCVKRGCRAPSKRSDRKGSVKTWWDESHQKPPEPPP